MIELHSKTDLHRILKQGQERNSGTAAVGEGSEGLNQQTKQVPAMVVGR